MWKVTKYNYSNDLPKYNIEVPVLYLNIFTVCYFILLLHCISESKVSK